MSALENSLTKIKFIVADYLNNVCSVGKVEYLALRPCQNDQKRSFRKRLSKLSAETFENEGLSSQASVIFIGQRCSPIFNDLPLHVNSSEIDLYVDDTVWQHGKTAGIS